MKVRLKNKDKVYDLQPICIGRIRYTRTAPIMLEDYYGEIINVGISKYPQYDFVFKTKETIEWNLCKEWVEEV